MEMKLTNTAAQLPEPKLSFQMIEEAARKTETLKRTPLRLLRAALVVILVLGLATTAYAYGKGKYGLWSGLNSRGFGDVTLLCWQYDYEFPETLAGSPFISVHTLYGAPHGATHLEALLMPTYRMCSINYGFERYEVWDNGGHRWTENKIHVSFGTTENENWKYHFSVADDGSCNSEGVDPDSQRTVEYEEYTLHLYTIGSTHNVRWEDEKKEMVIDITCWNAENLDHVVEIAKELIDLNR